MATTPTPVFPQVVKITPQSYLQGTDSAGTYKTVVTAGANGTKVVSLIVNSFDGSASHVLTLALTRSATTYPIGSYTLPVNAGTDGATAAVDMLQCGPAAILQGLPVDNDGQKYIYLESGDTLQMTFATALTSGKNLYCVAISSNF